LFLAQVTARLAKFSHFQGNIAKHGKIHIRKIMKVNPTPSLWATLALDTFLCATAKKFETEKVFFTLSLTKPTYKRSSNFEI
jgi:hypothetical protein